MAFGINMVGEDVEKMTSSEIKEALSVAEYPDDEGYNGSLIYLTLNKGVINNNSPYRIKGLQTLDMAIDDAVGEARGYLTKGVKGESISKTSVVFTASRFGVHTAIVPNTEFNVRVIAATISSGMFFNLSKAQDVDVIAEKIKTLSEEISAREEYATAYAMKTVVESVHQEFATVVKGLKETFGEGFDKCSEYRKEIEPKIKAGSAPLKIAALRATTTLDELKEAYPMPMSDEELIAQAKAKEEKAKKAEAKAKADAAKKAKAEAKDTPPKEPTK